MLGHPCSAQKRSKVSDQLHLFSQPEQTVSCAADSPLTTESARLALGRWPGLYLGTSSWTFPGWSELVYGGEYSKTVLADRGLRAYSNLGFFRTVSLDRTYYRPMSEQGYLHLASQVPQGFKFVVKAPRELLRPTTRGFDLAAFSREFLTPLTGGLGDKLGVILIQFPPGTAADYGRPFLGYLSRFLKGLPRSLTFSLEVRDEELLDSDLSEAMKGAPVSLCGSIHSSLPSPDQQLLKVPPTPEIPLVFRWNIRPSMAYEDAKGRFEPFREIQMEDIKRRELLVRLVKRALKAGRSVYVTANNKAEGCAPLTLLRFLEGLDEEL